VTFRTAEQVAAVGEASALAREAYTNARFLDGEVKRTRQLVDSGSLPSQAFNKAVSERAAAQARFGAAAASSKRLSPSWRDGRASSRRLAGP